HILTGAGRRVGMASTDGIYIGERRIDTGDCSGPLSAQKVLMNPAVDAAVLETARGGILRAGLGFDQCDVAVVTNIGEGDHLGLADIETPEKLAWVKSTLVFVVKPTGTAVLNAADPLVANMAEYCKGSVLYFALDGEHPILSAHRAQGGRAVFVRDNVIVLAEGEAITPLIPLADVPLTHGGRIGFQVENVLAATGAVWSLGLPLPMLRLGLMSFTNDLDKIPGRFNLLEIGGATVILDYGHNVSALERLLEAIASFPHERRTVVYSAAGDRRDGDIIRQGELLGDAFDRVILYEDPSVFRGRAPGEIAALFRKGLASGTRVSEIQEVGSALESVEVALKSARASELVLIQVDLIDESIDLVRRYLASDAAGRPIDLTEALQAPDSGAILAAQVID
ncbi:MAG: UDP-N-acetylmuramyl tripeptide synthase, partial [Isosphaeraceae bacterium]|nr:UDP-N-acetylmuramyl tripeptide synthase [Isosphaeraceae bacterium]